MSSQWNVTTNLTGVLRQKSTWFKEILDIASTANEDTDELCDKPKGINLTDEDPAVFSRFNQWIYMQKLCTEAETPKELPWSTICDIYTFAERRGIPTLQNACINVIIRKVKNGGAFPGQDILNPLWKTTAKVSQLRLLLLELYAVKCNLKAALVRNGGFHASDGHLLTKRHLQQHHPTNRRLQQHHQTSTLPQTDQVR